MAAVAKIPDLSSLSLLLFLSVITFAADSDHCTDICWTGLAENRKNGTQPVMYIVYIME